MITHTKVKGTALVTGGAKRIGKEICLTLAHMGYKVAIHYNTSKRQAQQLATTICRQGGEGYAFQCDLSNEGQTQQLVSNVHKKYAKLNLLINNASIFEPSRIKSDVSILHHHFAINLNAPYVLTKQFAQKRRRGHIINILDTHITQNVTHYTAYLLSKKALSELTKLSAVELAPNIRVNAISPGLVLPPNNKGNDYLQRLARKIPLKTKGNVKQIGQSIKFLIQNTYLTGQIIFNDGGEHLL